MQDVLVLPIRVDSIVIDTATRVGAPMADFSRLPYYDGRRDINPGRPYLSEEIVTSPFEEASAWLPSGVHLHWTLPPALCRGRQDLTGAASSAESQVAFLTFPKAPNRWLVRTPDDWWIVESDYLHPDGEDHSTDAVSYLLPPDEQQRLKSKAPFRFIGRQVRLSDWNPRQAGAEHLEGLTAIGWGHPAFHSYYPNCWSVFGFHDPSRAAAAAKSTASYEVFGWYSRVANDPLAEFLKERPGLTGADLVQAFQDVFRWQLSDAPGYPAKRPARLLLAGNLDPAPGAATTGARLDSVTIGATGAEALSAYLARIQYTATAPALPAADQPRAQILHEEALESILLASGLDPNDPDYYAKLQEARHDKEFVGVPGGSHWTIRGRAADLPADASKSPNPAVPIPLAAAERLAELQQLQKQRDGLAREQDALSTQLYSDWCKYLECKYPPRDTREDYPDVDEVRRYIETHSLAQLEGNFAAAARMTLSLSDSTDFIAGLLAQADVAACAVHLEDVLNWSAFAQNALATGLIATTTAAGLQNDPASVTHRTAALSMLNAAVPTPQLPPAFDPKLAGASETFAAWLMRPPVDAVEVERATARVRNAIFPRKDGWTKQLQTGWIANEQSRSEQVRIAQRNRAALELLLRGTLRVVPKVRHELDIQPGPRFWQPRDPVLLLEGDAVIPATDFNRRYDSTLVNVFPIGNEIATSLARAMDAPGGAAPVADGIRSLVAHSRIPGAPTWRPLMLDWKVALHEEPAGSAAAPAVNGPEYDPGFLTSRYQLEENDPELAVLKPAWQAGSQRASVYSGSSILTEHATAELAVTLKQRPTPPAGQANKFLETVVTQTGNFFGQRNLRQRLQAISLSGFHAALRMQEAIFPLAVDDPLAFSDSRAFAARVKRAVGRHTQQAPRPLLHFMPLRSGRLQIVHLRVVDAFGRVEDLDLTKAMIHSAESAPISAAAPAPDAPLLAQLPPRLTVAARLQMRWLQAGRQDVESHDHPATGPICGWLIPNLLDQRIMAHTADGEAIGSVDLSGRWRPAPGHARMVPPDDIEDAGLRRVVTQLIHETDAGRQELFATMLAALDRIAPRSVAQHRALSLLMARPIAVVRASLRLELLGNPPLDQSWPELRIAMEGGKRGSGRLLDVRFPVRIGEHGQLDDGVVGFWVEKGAGFEDRRFYAPQGLPNTQLPAGPVEGGGGHITLRLNDDAAQITLLVDPRAKVHATTGILPTKVLSIPEAQFAAALASIGVTFFVAPLLTDPNLVRVATPAEPGYSWSWLERRDSGWLELPDSMLAAPELRAALTAQQEVREGWLKLSPDPRRGGQQ